MELKCNRMVICSTHQAERKIITCNLYLFSGIVQKCRQIIFKVFILNQMQGLIMPPTSKKLEGRIALGSFVRSSSRPSRFSCEQDILIITI